MENPANVPDIDYQPPQPPPEPSGSGKKVAIGCGIGCFVLIIIAIVGGIILYQSFVKIVLDFTGEDPVEFAEPVADQATIQGVLARYDAFADAMGTGKEAEPLVLTGDEVNLLIYHHPSFSDLRDVARVAIEEDRFTAKISIPLDGLSEFSKKFEGRYLNGEATFRFLLSYGALEVYLVDLEGASGKAPESIMSQLRSQDLMKDVQTDKEFDAIFQALEDLKIEGGKLHIVPKKPEDRPQPSP